LETSSRLFAFVFRMFASGDAVLPSQGMGAMAQQLAERPPVAEPILVLNGEGLGIVNNLCVPSLVSSTYAPPGAALVSATVLGIPAIDCDHLESSVRQQLQEWFGNQVQTWRHLRTYYIPFALPAQSPPALSPVAKSPRRRDGIWLCGDYWDTASIQGAMVSGRRAAEEILSTQARA
jgi:phytoene dehydrogenase-like protein